MSLMLSCFPLLLHEWRASLPLHENSTIHGRSSTKHHETASRDIHWVGLVEACWATIHLGFQHFDTFQTKRIRLLKEKVVIHFFNTSKAAPY